LTKPTGRPKGRPLGARQGRWTPGQIREEVMAANSKAEWLEKFRGLPDVEQWKIRVALEPKALDVGGSTTLKLIIEGFSPKPAIAGELVQHEEPEAPRAIPSQTSARPMPHVRSAPCPELAAIRSRTPRFIEDSEPASPHALRVPRGPDSLGPAEWRTPLYPKEDVEL